MNYIHYAQYLKFTFLVTMFSSMAPVRSVQIAQSSSSGSGCYRGSLQALQSSRMFSWLLQSNRMLNSARSCYGMYRHVEPRARWAWNHSSELCLGGVAGVMHFFPKVREKYWYVPYILTVGAMYHWKNETRDLLEQLNNKVTILDHRVQQCFHDSEKNNERRHDEIMNRFSGHEQAIDTVGEIFIDTHEVQQEKLRNIGSDVKSLAEQDQRNYELMINKLHEVQKQGEVTQSDIAKIAETCKVTQGEVMRVLSGSKQQIASSLDTISRQVQTTNRCMSTFMLMFMNTVSNKNISHSIGSVSLPIKPTQMPVFITKTIDQLRLAQQRLKDENEL